MKYSVHAYAFVFLIQRVSDLHKNNGTEIFKCTVQFCVYYLWSSWTRISVHGNTKLIVYVEIKMHQWKKKKHLDMKWQSF